ncbi:MAG: outer membrane protein assembly factor BamE [Alphaproteobacteria bacterium]|nr:outer membrane protein assembly factor BamE [Alphaproteobacteria bacterium]
MKKSILISGVILGLLTSCQPFVNSRGNVTVEENLDKFVVGKTTMKDVLEMCGTPSLHKDNFTWIYIGAKSEEIAFTGVNMTNRCVVKMVFDTNKVLRSVNRIPLGEDDSLLNDEEITQLITDEQAAKRAHALLRKGN